MENAQTARRPLTADFDRCPFLVIWETTRSCALACKHCRADAMLGRDPKELDTGEGRALIDQVAAMGTPILILSGGDPLNRPDLDELVRHGKARGLRMGTIPAATPSLTRERLASLKAAGVDQLALSLDGPKAEWHDSFRETPGAFERTVQGAAWARELGLPLQINTCLSEWNYHLIDSMIEFVASLKPVFWEVFFLVPTGRGRRLAGLTPGQFEEAFAKLHAVNDRHPFVVKVTEAPHYRRFVIHKELERSRAEAAGRITRALARPRGINGSIGMSPQAVNSGKGFLFIDHQGTIFPSGFLPIPAGSVREESLAKVYRESDLFRSLRNPKLLQGKCGRCEFAAVCGGSRARAYAVAGDPFAEDPSCAYQPGTAPSLRH